MMWHLVVQLGVFQEPARQARDQMHNFSLIMEMKITSLKILFGMRAEIILYSWKMKTLESTRTHSFIFFILFLFIFIFLTFSHNNSNSNKITSNIHTHINRHIFYFVLSYSEW
ncbi:hypothetical protein OQL93_144 [Saccharomyces cerevisiae synthetic construct]|uniref:Putative uncharacterized membrane protein YIL030W-A n=2 Tax=Saccharomyces cerevisiae TaxID=4932 RepID=YI030_YEAST|nr:RecName: Full=Putative uncharacterized membrane protein YIL030W-A [Saccharomyces cerevisiae S288C]AHX39312.1 hypothetical protein YIL030W-A [Saccharomyces cerevisiae]EWG85366.1 hypothetical protein R008_I10931 [Saccharomyces cerevisiae R008]WHM58845.1 hypothetical protein OQL93_144 [Saccharomyces cerevisiae synthetic construct]CAY80479.1 EC1118_1I12_1651p [Saccharomyces cerevisiae EC1118]